MRYLLGLLSVVGCSGSVPAIGPPDAEIDGAIEAGLTVSGKTLAYFTNMPLGATALATDGLQPAVLTTSAADASYALDHVPIGSKLFVSASRMMYRPTRSLPIDVADMPIARDLYVMSVADTGRQYVSLGKTATPGKAVLFAEMQNDAAAPVVGIPLGTAVVLVVCASIQPAEIAMAKKAATTAPPRSAEANGVRRKLFIVRKM